MAYFLSKKKAKSMSVIQEPFSDGASLVHRLDPRGKIVVAALFAILMAVAKSFPATLAGLALALIWLVLARLPWKKVLDQTAGGEQFHFFPLVGPAADLSG